MRMEPLHRDKDGEDAMAIAEGGRGFAKSRDVAAVFFVHLVARLMEIHGAVLAFLVGAGGGARDVFRDGRFHRPDKGVNWTKNENRGLLVPARFAQGLAREFGWMRLERPVRIGAQVGTDARPLRNRLP